MLLLNPHYMRWVCAKEGEKFDEDWTPFEGKHPRTGKPYLEVPPIESADTSAIEEYLQWAVETLLAQRRVEGREGGKRFVPYFIVLDEWPDIASEIKKSPDWLSKLLRQGRKYGIFVVVASQDFQVKTIGLDSGSVRKCLLTCFYTGGDTTTAKELLYSEAPKSIPENKLGEGVIMLRCKGTGNEAVLVRVPFVDNLAVYKLLGPSTFKKADAAPSDVQEVVGQEEESIVTSALHRSITTILDLYERGKLTDEQMSKLIDALPVQADEYVAPVEPAAKAQAGEQVREEDQRKLTTLHRRVLEHYAAGVGLRKLGELVGVGKDKAGDLVKELKKWGYLKDDQPNVDD